MTHRLRNVVGTALVLFVVAELASMAVGESLLRAAFCSSPPADAISDCLVPGTLRISVLLAALAGAVLLTTRTP